MEGTQNLVRELLSSGARLLTVHGRTKEQNKQLVGRVNWEAINQIRVAKNEMGFSHIPMYVNGGMGNSWDVRRYVYD